MVFCKSLAVLVAYAALWDALSRWRVRDPARRFQLRIYGAVTLLYLLLVLITGGGSEAASGSPSSDLTEAFYNQYTRGYFGAFAATALLLGALEVAVASGLFDPSLPLLSRWWVCACFEGPLWRMIGRRAVGSPLTVDEAEAFLRHAAAGTATMAAGAWALSVALGLTQWGHFDPVGPVIALRALNTWLDSRLRDRAGCLRAIPPLAGHLTGCGRTERPASCYQNCPRP